MLRIVVFLIAVVFCSGTCSSPHFDFISYQVSFRVLQPNAYTANKFGFPKEAILARIASKVELVFHFVMISGVGRPVRIQIQLTDMCEMALMMQSISTLKPLSDLIFG